MIRDMEGRPARWPGFAAAAWAFAFAAASFCWAAGGTVLADAIGSGLRNLPLEHDSDPQLTAL